MAGMMQAMLAGRLAATPSGPVDPLPEMQIGDSVLTPADAHCGFTFHSNGTISVVGNDSSVASGNWYLPTTVGIGALYSIFVTKDSGIDPNEPGSETVGAFHNLASNRFFGWQRTSIGSSIAALQIGIKLDSSGLFVAVESSVDVIANVDA